MNSSAENSLKDKFVLFLKTLNAYKTGEFILASGKKSHFYFDLRLFFGNPEAFNFVITKLAEKIRTIKNYARVDGVAGIPTAGLPLAAGVALTEKLPLYYPRKPKAHGLKRVIEGGSVYDQHIIVIDDVITSGSSKIEPIKALRSHGAIVNHCLVILDREMGGADILQENGVQLHSLVKLSEIKEFLD